MLTADDIHDALPGAHSTCELIARFLNAGRDGEAARILREQAESVRDFKRARGKPRLSEDSLAMLRAAGLIA